MWILYERPMKTPHTLRWRYTNTAGLAVSVEPSAMWFDKGQMHMGFGTVIQAVPVPLPDPESIQDRVVCFEAQGSGVPLFKAPVP
jgi:hypothetical protein